VCHSVCRSPSNPARPRPHTCHPQAGWYTQFDQLATYIEDLQDTESNKKSLQAGIDWFIEDKGLATKPRKLLGLNALIESEWVQEYAARWVDGWAGGCGDVRLRLRGGRG
jgi:hypothetical protein